MKKINIIGEKYGKLTVVSEHSKTRNGHERYTCLCDCGNSCNILKTHLRQNNTKSCGCDFPKGKNNKNWNGYEEISGDYWYNHIIRGANGTKGRKKLDLSITKEYVWNLYLNQNKKCALSNIDIKFPTKGKDKSYTCSLDRIDSSLGYIEGNVQWVHKDINRMKNAFNQDYFIKMCKLITEKCEV